MGVSESRFKHNVKGVLSGDEIKLDGTVFDMPFQLVVSRVK